jgi:hypothetical protein
LPDPVYDTVDFVSLVRLGTLDGAVAASVELLQAEPGSFQYILAINGWMDAEAFRSRIEPVIKTGKIPPTSSLRRGHE